MYSRVKICGITRQQDALDAIALGADALGFVFYPNSERCVDAKVLQGWIEALPPFIALVGVFVNPSYEQVEEVLRCLPLTHLQFHGDEPQAFCQQFGLPYLKSVAMKEGVKVATFSQLYDKACALLLDTYAKEVSGGTGKVFDWSWVDKDLTQPIVLAGGLNCENVRSAIQIVKPYMIDISGGVEQAKGIKSYQKMRDFICAAKNLGVRNG